MFLYGKKVLYWKIISLKKLFFTEKNIYENVKNIYDLIWEIFFRQKMFVLQIKYISFLNIYSFCQKKIFFDHKKYIC